MTAVTDFTAVETAFAAVQAQQATAEADTLATITASAGTSLAVELNAIKDYYAEVAMRTLLTTLGTDLTTLGADITPPPPPPLKVVTPALPAATSGTAYAAQLAGSGGSGTLEWSATGLPSGLTISTTGDVTGTPSVFGNFSVVVTLKDSNGDTPVSAVYTMAVASPAPPPPPTSFLFGCYSGAANVAGSNQFATEAGITPGLYSEYLDGSSWPNMVGSPGTEPWVIGQLKGKLGSMKLHLSVPLVTAGFANGAAAMAAYVAEPTVWSAYFTTLATNMIAAGFSDADIRLMWEPDQFTYKTGDLVSAANYATLWKLAHTAMMGVAGAKFTWTWYFAAAFSAQTNATAYPGSAYVDYVSLDFYDQCWVGGTGAPPYNGTPFTPAQEQVCWANYLSAQLNPLVAFAKAQGKPVAFGECGVINRSDNHGGNDCPTWVSLFIAWCKANNVAWASWFNFDESGLDSLLSHFPNSEAELKAVLAA